MNSSPATVAPPEPEQTMVESLLHKLGVRIEPAIEIEPDAIRRMADQPRVDFDKSRLQALQDGIKEMGQLVDGIVRPLRPEEIAALPSDQKKIKYEMVDGERRWIGCRALKRKFKAKIAHGLTPQTQFVLSIALNFNREDHNPLEKILAVRRLLDDKWSIKDIAIFFGMSEPSIYGYQKLLGLHQEILALLGPPTPEASRIGMTVAREFLDLKPAVQLGLYKEICGKTLTVQIVRRAVRHKIESCSDARQPGTEPHERDSHDILRLLTRLSERGFAATGGITNKEIRSMNPEDRKLAAQHLVALSEDVAMLLKQLAYDFDIKKLDPLKRDE